MNSYQKLREENEALRIKFDAMKERLFEVCLRPTLEKTAKIVAGIKVLDHMEKVNARVEQSLNERYRR